MSANLLAWKVEDMRRKWGWFLALGIALIVIGIIALSTIPAATLVTVVVLGWLMVFGGIVETVNAFYAQGWGIFLHLVGGILGILVGLLVITYPVAGALSWTLLFSAFFTVVGVYRMIVAARLKFPNWGWAAFDGAITFLLGIMLWVHWPYSGLWFLGFAVGISLILRGWSQIMFALAARRVTSIVSSELPRAA